MTNIYFSWFWRLKVQEQGANMAGWWRLSSGLQMANLYSHVAERTASSLISYKDTNPTYKVPAS